MVHFRGDETSKDVYKAKHDQKHLFLEHRSKWGFALLFTLEFAFFDLQTMVEVIFVMCTEIRILQYKSLSFPWFCQTDAQIFLNLLR